MEGTTLNCTVDRQPTIIENEELLEGYRENPNNPENRKIDSRE